jgi:hypothetical protein
MTAVVAAADGTSDERAMIVARAWATAIGPPGPDWLTLVSLAQRYGSAQFFDNRLSHVPLSAAAGAGLPKYVALILSRGLRSRVALSDALIRAATATCVRSTHLLISAGAKVGLAL